MKYLILVKNAKLCYNRISWSAWFFIYYFALFQIVIPKKILKNCSCMYVEMANIKTHPLCGSFIEYTYFWNLEEARIMVKECLQKAVVLYAGLELEILSYTQDQQNIGIMYVVHYTEMLKGCKFLLVIRSILYL